MARRVEGHRLARPARAAAPPMGTGWDVAYAALNLHSDEAGFVTGVSLAVDGGEGVSWGS